MIAKVEQILNTPIEELIGSSLVMVLIEVYSKLYLNGENPGGCERCLRTAYQLIKKNGMEKAIEYEEIKNRTCKPAWKGLTWIPTRARHYDSELITDKQAIDLLEKGDLKLNAFEILPAEYGKPIPEEKIQESFEKRHAPKQPKEKVKKKGA